MIRHVVMIKFKKDAKLATQLADTWREAALQSLAAS